MGIPRFSLFFREGVNRGIPIFVFGLQFFGVAAGDRQSHFFGAKPPIRVSYHESAVFALGVTPSMALFTVVRKFEPSKGHQLRALTHLLAEPRPQPAAIAEQNYWGTVIPFARAKRRLTGSWNHGDFIISPHQWGHLAQAI